MANPFVGTWKTKWLSYSNGVVIEGLVTVSESLRTDPSGKTLNGMFDAPNAKPGTLFGAVKGDTWTGDWWLSPSQRGTFTFKLRKGNKSFNGTYNAINQTPPPQTAPKDPYWSGTLMRTHADAPHN